MNDDELFEALIGMAVQGERLRVANRINEGLPLNVADQQIADCGVGTIGEHTESGRRRLLRIINKKYADRKDEFLAELLRRLLNEGTDKP